MTGILMVSAILVWVLGLILLCVVAFEAVNDNHPRRVVLVVSAFLWIVVPAGLAIDSSVKESDRPLCERGHEEMQARRVWHMAGKVMVPTTSLRRVWVCEVRSEGPL